MRRALSLALLLASVALAADPLDRAIKPFLRTHCAGCHGIANPAAGLSIPALLATPLADRPRWEQIAHRLHSGEMPPKSSPRPPADQALAVTTWIEAAYDRLDQSRPQDPGRVTARRLNRFEYSRSVADLLGFNLNPAEDFPTDPAGYGFDNIADVLSLSPLLTEQYLKAAERIAHAAIPLDSDPPPATMQRYLAERIGQDRQLRMAVDHPFPADGTYTLRSAFYQGLRDGTQVRMRLFLDGRETASEVLKFYYQIDRGIEARNLQIPAGLHRVEASIEVLPNPLYKGNLPYLEYIQVYGPTQTTPAAQSSAYRRFFTCGHAPGKHSPACARRILAPLARQAFRRPVEPAELDGLLTLTHKEQSRTGSFEQAMRTALTALLVSPHFLFRVERDRGPGARPLSSHELATRLSYFLWSSLPDAELNRQADANQLHAGLTDQTRRLLAHPKSGALAESFAAQWLQTRNLAVLKPDPAVFPSFTGELAADMRVETEKFFTAILREDRSILDFLDGRFTFLNERLAGHYGIPGITGDHFRRVELDGLQRSGVLTQASVLTVSSYPTRTSPVIRGKWVLENLLHQPPPPPPPNVPSLDEKAAANSGTLRQQLEKHRADPVCAGCHSRMDPLGFSLENYDAIGRWRSTDGGAPIDTSTELPNGQRFSSSAELKFILRADPDTFAKALTEKLLTYALGRGLDLRDRPAIRQIVARVRAQNYRFSALILAIVESAAFQQRRPEGAKP